MPASCSLVITPRSRRTASRRPRALAHVPCLSPPGRGERPLRSLKPSAREYGVHGVQRAGGRRAHGQVPRQVSSSSSTTTVSTYLPTYLLLTGKYLDR
eukprot:scaffold81409_cov52-Phaeocystis_antarctica.AAC.1